MNTSVLCSVNNLDAEYLEMEMILNSLFDESYVPNVIGIVASNGYVEYTYIKKGTSYSMAIKVLSINSWNDKFKLKFFSTPFMIDRKFITENKLKDRFDLSSLYANELIQHKTIEEI